MSSAASRALQPQVDAPVHLLQPCQNCCSIRIHLSAIFTLPYMTESGTFMKSCLLMPD